MEHEIALHIDFHFVGAREAKRDGAEVGARTHDEVVFQLPLITVVDEVDTGIDLAVTDLRVGGDVDPPLRGIVADEVVGLAGQFLQPRHARIGVGVGEAHAQHGPGRWPSRRRSAMRGWLARG